MVTKNIRYIFSLSIIILLLLALSGCSLPGLTISFPTSTQTTTAVLIPTPDPINPTFVAPTISAGTPQSGLPDFVSVIAKVRPSVVAINTTSSGISIFGSTFTQEGAGSGWIIDSGGLIVTNNHVVEGAITISVTLEDGRNFSADTVRTDPVTDLAVIKINSSNLPSLLPGDSSALRVGDWVVAIGNSLGQGISATKGIVSALGVSVSADQGETLYDLIQTDAAINPGNSGGPLVNMSGEVVGINSIKVAQVGVEGMGYAISSQAAIPIINELVTNGYVTRPWLGVSLYTVDQTAVRQLELGVDKGVLLRQVSADGPADKAGLIKYDVITIFNGKAIATVEDLVKEIRNCKVGQTVQTTYWRGSIKNTTSIILEKAPPPSTP
jgi:serine protease Do